MPASDYDARQLALPLEDESTGDTPIWSRRSHSHSFARNSSHSSRQPSLRRRLVDTYHKINRRVSDQYNNLSPLHKLLFIVGGLGAFVLGILFLVYNERIFASLQPVAKKWRDIPAGWLILWALIFVVSFPPLIGYSSLLTIAGFVYGFPNGCVFLHVHSLVMAATNTHLAGSLPPRPPSLVALLHSSSRAPSSRTWYTALSQTTSASPP
jgi:hypothetical protein